MSLLSARSVTVRYGMRLALDGVDLEVAEGQVVGLIGPNGAGKTTLLKALAGLVPVEAGELLVAGRPPSKRARQALARDVAYLAQGTVVHWPLAVERIVALGRLPHLGPWQRPSEADRAAIERAMREADVAAFAGRAVTTLSAGERTRTMIARALAVEPRLLLADEPVTALDPYHQLQVMGLIAGLAGRGGGVLVVLHDLTLAARFCDRLVLLDGGRLVAEGTPDEVLTDAHLRESYGVSVVRGEVGGQRYVIPWERLDPGAGERAP